MGQSDTMVEIFNSFNGHIQFTIEKEQDRGVPFLDTKLIRDASNTVLLDWYVKPTHSGRYINYNSHHTEKIKINLVLALKTRIEKLSHPSFKLKNLNRLYNTLLDNSYPKSLLWKLIYNTRPVLDVSRGSGGLAITNQPSQEISAFLTQNQPCYHFSIPYIKDVTTKIVSVFKDEQNIKVVPRYSKTVGLSYTKLKDKDPPLKTSGVVYGIPCLNCEKVYIGQTSRVFKDRLTSHRSDCRNNKQTCALAQHTFDTGHNFNFAEPKVLITENRLRKRLFLEMVEIHLSVSTVNKRRDIDDLSSIYSNLLNIEHNNNNKKNRRSLDTHTSSDSD